MVLYDPSLWWNFENYPLLHGYQMHTTFQRLDLLQSPGGIKGTTCFGGPDRKCKSKPFQGSSLWYTGFFPQPVQNLSQLLLFSCLQDGQNNNGYVPYVDYARDYNPPPPTEGSRESLSAVTSVPSVTGVPSIHPCYSAAYGNSCLRNSNTSLLPAPPSYSTATRNGAVPQVARLPNSPTSQYIVPTSQPTTMRRGTLATHV